MSTVAVTTVFIQYSISNAANFTELATLTNGPGTGGLDMAVNAAAGDICLLWPTCALEFTTGNANYMDWRTVAGGHFVSGGLTGGVTAWAVDGVTPSVLGAAFAYTVVSGDISSGQVKFRPYVKSTSPSTVSLDGASGDAAYFNAWNITALVSGA